MPRIERPDLKAIITATMRIELSNGQMFCSVKFKSTEIEPCIIIGAHNEPIGECEIVE
jgi:hypothetical protein